MSIMNEEMTVMTSEARRVIASEEEFVAHNYHPLEVVVASADGAWVTDVHGKRYLDCLAAYSAVNFGHSNQILIDAARDQLDRVTLTSRAFYNDQLGSFAQALAELAGKDMVLPMNTGAEAVESAIKIARAWGYRVKGVAANQANIIVMAGNFHGRTTTIISFSDDEDARADFGPYTPGFRTVPYGDAEALAAAIDENTVAVLVEPIQGESGIVVPPAGYLPAVRALCTDNNVLFIADEIQSGLGRTGSTFACDLVNVVPDLYLLGKALGGGIRTTARPSAATRSQLPSVAPSCGCSPVANIRSERGCSVLDCTSGSVPSSGTACSRCAAPDSGLESTSTRRSRPGVRSASG
jgi:ornithine--oxo-acid transaminase